MSTTLFLLVVLVVVVLWTISVYNRLITLKNRCQEAWSDIEVQLKRRYDLIPNLVETVRGYAAHEREVFERVSEARARAMGAQTLKDKQEAENVLTATLKTLFAVTESYPQLLASQNFLELQRELRDTEDKIQAARRFYNTNARDMNVMIESFPSNLVAQMSKVGKREFFELEEPAAREPVKVQF